MNFTKNDIVQKDLEKLECPFNWDMPENGYDEPEHDESDFKKDGGSPMYELISFIMNAYVGVTFNEDSVKILETMKKCEEIFEELKQR